MITYLTFAGKSSRDYKVYISGQGTYNAPARVYAEYEVPGRNGKLFVDQNRYENIEVTYPAFIFEDMRNNLDGFRNFLLSQRGYQRLEDTYHPDEYRMAVFKDGLEADIDPSHEFSAFDLTFDCKPQRFLKSGEQKVTLSSDGSIYNPTLFESNPKLWIHGTGEVIIGDYTITVGTYSFSTTTPVVIDCETMRVTDGGERYNFSGVVSFADRKYPVLKPGSNTVVFSGNVRQVDIVPRWWKL